MRVVKAGDTLPALCARIYGDPGWYLAVARFNGLDNFRVLPAGTRIVLPPAERLRALEPALAAARSAAR